MRLLIWLDSAVEDNSAPHTTFHSIASTHASFPFNVFCMVICLTFHAVFQVAIYFKEITKFYTEPVLMEPLTCGEDYIKLSFEKCVWIIPTKQCIACILEHLIHSRLAY